MKISVINFIRNSLHILLFFNLCCQAQIININLFNLLILIYIIQYMLFLTKSTRSLTFILVQFTKKCTNIYHVSSLSLPKYGRNTTILTHS